MGMVRPCGGGARTASLARRAAHGAAHGGEGATATHLHGRHAGDPEDADHHGDVPHNLERRVHREHERTRLILALRLSLGVCDLQRNLPFRLRGNIPRRRSSTRWTAVRSPRSTRAALAPTPRRRASAALLLLLLFRPGDRHTETLGLAVLMARAAWVPLKRRALSSGRPQRRQPQRKLLPKVGGRRKGFLVADLVTATEVAATAS